MNLLRKNLLILISLLHFVNFTACWAQVSTRLELRAIKISDKWGERIRVDRIGNIYILSSQQHSIFVLNPDHSFNKTIGGFGQGPAEFNLPVDFDLDSLGNIYVVDRFNRRLQKLNNTGKYLDEVPSNPTVMSIAVSTAEKIFVNDTQNNGILSRVDFSGKNFDSFGKYRNLDFLDPMIATIHESKDRGRLLRGFQQALNEAIARLDASGNLYVLFYSAPILRKYNPTGALVFETGFSSPNLTSLIEESRRSLKAKILARQVVYDVLSQDFCIDPINGTIYITTTADAPGCFVFNTNGKLIKEINLFTEDNNQLNPVGICYYGTERWIVSNAKGTFMFTVKDQ